MYLGASFWVVGLLWGQLQHFSKNPKFTAQDRTALKAAKQWVDSGPVGGTDGSVTYRFGERTPTLVCSLFHVCSADLEPGEEITGIQVGDTMRWTVDIGHSGMGARKQLSVVFKPSDAGLKTNALIFTTRRKYALNLLSHRTLFLPTVKFSYPEDPQLKLLELQARVEQTEREQESARVDSVGLQIEDLDYAYELSGDSPSWRPIQVFSTKRQTYIRFPAGVEYKEVPVFTVTRDKNFGKKVLLVNYRIKHMKGTTFFEVDGLFEQAQLISGVGGERQAVVITYKGGSQPAAMKGQKWKR
ncbi:MAG: P-type conjugative transfer protein TrbG [Myxococcales bacterium]|nr:P-type conjugative transfer protein TrbG [Myxococcales bacterium]